MTDMLAQAREILSRQPFSVAMGARLLAHEKGRSVIEMPIAESHGQHLGMTHGGVLCYLADNALTFAGGSVLGPCVTLEMKINYLRPARGERLVAEASVINAGKRFAVTECKVTAFENGEPVLVAAAQGTICKLER